jgi:LysM repeat protein
MTRETKIGLLVGLAFIIVIGILLSDHLTTRGELPAAQLTQVGDTVRTATVNVASAQPPLTPIPVPTGVTPTAPVPTHDELTSTPPTAIVQVGAPRSSSPAVNIPITGPNNTAATAASGSTEPAPSATNDAGIGRALLNASGITPPTTPLANDPTFQPVTPGQSANDAIAKANNLKPHKAEKGDTVSHLAAKYLGANTAANRQAIIDANPALKADPAKIVIGRTYLIPAKPGESASADSALVDAPNAVDPSSAVALTTDAKTSDKKDSKSSKTTTYTVKSSDTLWKIANGSPSVLKEIQDLNKDVLKGKTIVHPGLTLKIPSKSTAASFH